MNSDDFLMRLSEKLNLDSKDAAAEMVASISDIITEGLQEGNSFALENFGVLGVKKQKEHIVVNQTTGQRILIPPSLEVSFEPSESLSNKINVI